MSLPVDRGEGAPAQIAEPTSESRRISRLMLFFALVYIVEGLGQTGGLIARPLNYFLRQVYGWTPVQVTAALILVPAALLRLGDQGAWHTSPLNAHRKNVKGVSMAVGSLCGKS